MSCPVCSITWITDERSGLGSVAVGGRRDLDPEILLANRIYRVVIVIPMRDLPDYSIYGIESLYAPWHDDNSLMELYEAIGFIKKAIADGAKVLVACGAGIERAPTTVVAWLLDQGYPLDAARKYVEGVHPASQIRIHWLTDVGFNTGQAEIF